MEEEREETAATTTTTTTDDVKRKNAPRPVAPPVVSQNFLEGEEENFMTMSPKEKAVWIKMIKTRHASLVKREQDHKKWLDTMIKRRVDVYNRSKKLLNTQRERFRFLFKMAEVVKNLSENKLKEKDNDKREEDNDNNNNNNNNRQNNDDNVNNTDDNKHSVDHNTDAGETVQGDDSVPTILVKEPTQ